jgi:hypothetical protein
MTASLSICFSLGCRFAHRLRSPLLPDFSKATPDRHFDSRKTLPQFYVVVQAI